MIISLSNKKPKTEEVASTFGGEALCYGHFIPNSFKKRLWRSPAEDDCTYNSTTGLYIQSYIGNGS
jgi:hypothetical protein